MFAVVIRGGQIHTGDEVKLIPANIYACLLYTSQPEDEGILVACASIHGNTKKAAELLAEKLKATGVKAVSYTHLISCVSAANCYFFGVVRVTKVYIELHASMHR